MQSKLNIIDPNRVLETKVLCQKSDLILERMAMGIAVRTEASRQAVISSYAGNTSCTHQDVPLLLPAAALAQQQNIPQPG